MPSRILVVVGLIVVVFALAGAPAWAQSAGDEQYDDPFAGQEDQGSSAQPAPTATAAPAPAPAPAAAQAAPAAPAAPTASAAQLPRTGAETLLTALAGVGLVMAGVGLRLRLPADGG
jgi:LPXTG-motif cell wall-anchored protein